MKKLLLLLLAAIAVLVWWVYRRQSEPLQVAFAKVQRETLSSTLITNGKVEPIEWEAVRPETGGLVDKVPVQEGQAVTRGTPLAMLAESGLPAELQAAEARLVQARSDLANVQAGGKSSDLTDIENELARARFDKGEAQREYASLRRLAEKQAATPVDVEAARGKLHQAELQIESLERRRASLVGKMDKTVAQARVKDAEAAVELARTRISQSIVRAPISGVVYNLSVRTGTYLNAGDLVANVGRLDRLRVRVYVDEPEMGRVASGQPVTITWDALPGRKWDGAVERKPSAIVPLGTRQVGEVLCTIDNPGRELVPGTNVNAEIRTSIVSQALTIPKAALRREPSGPGVFVLRGEILAWQGVKLGSSSVTRVQVLEGLSEGDSVALPADTVLRAGSRVKPVYP